MAKRKKTTLPAMPVLDEPSLHARIGYHVDDLARQLTLAHPSVQKRHDAIKARLHKTAMQSVGSQGETTMDKAYEAPKGGKGMKKKKSAVAEEKKEVKRPMKKKK
jgi:hypothetical protein